MPEFEIRRAQALSNRMMLNAIGFLATAIFLFYGEIFSVDYAWLGQVLGWVFVARAAFVIYAMLRPLLLRLTPEGFCAQGQVRNHRCAWKDVAWVDFSRPAKPSIIAYRKANGKDAAFALSRRAASDAQHEAALAFIEKSMPRIVTKNPHPWVGLGEKNDV